MFVSTNFIAKYFEIIDKGVFILAMSAICILSSSRNKKARSHDRVYTDIMKQTLYRHIVKTKTQNIFSSEYVVYLYYLYIRLQIIIKSIINV